jgi:hypothetical protein
MKTAIRSNHELGVRAGAIAVVFAIFACNLPGVTVIGASTTKPAVGGPSGTACLEGIQPGKTTKNEVVSLLGNPLATVQDGGFETLQYASAVYGQANSIAMWNGVVALVSVVQAGDKPLAWSEVKAQLGEPAFRAYTHYQQGSMTYAYPDRGRAYIADETMDVVFIQQCFAPISLADYMTAYGNSMPTEDPFIE